jgi:hypothetical protein
MFKDVKVGDVVCREFCGRQLMKVTAVDDELITAGMGWQFNREDGHEWDPDVPSIGSMSRLVKLTEEEQKKADKWLAASK